MGHCDICGKETKDSATVYQADYMGSTSSQAQSRNMFSQTTTTTTIKTYKNPMQRTYFCCKNCRKYSRMLFFILFIISSGLMVLCILGGPWNETFFLANSFFKLISIVCVLGVMVGFIIIPMLLFMIIYPYGSVESAIIAHMNKPEQS